MASSIMHCAANATLFGICALVAAVAFGSGTDTLGASSVVRLRAVAVDGAVQFGSGVVVAPEQVATACHVTRNAASIEISQGSKRWIAKEQVGSPLHDLCIIHARVSDVPIAPVRRSDTLRQGERVFAAGFQGGRADILVSAGVVAALYPYDGGPVVRTTAAFDFGSSGGGLFDEAGNLVGLLSFKGRAGETLRFALPSEWLSSDGPVATKFLPVENGAAVPAFWERPQADRPPFLGVAMAEAARERT